MAVLLLLMAGGGSAWATTGHTFVGQFGGPGTGDGQFGEPLNKGPVGVAVMPSTGEVFTLDAGQTEGFSVPRVQRFGADGAFASAFLIGSQYNFLGPIAADPAGAGALYVSANRSTSDQDQSPFAAVVKYDADGTFAYELDASTSGTTINNPISGASAVAVDPADGTVYVAATGPSGPAIDRFDGTTGAFLDSFDGSNGSPDGGFQCVSGLAVDGSHQVYVLDGCPLLGLGKNRVDRYGADGAFQATVVAGTPMAVAADPASDEVYVAEEGATGLQVTHFSAGGASVIYTFDASDAGSDVSGVRGMTVSGAGMVYTSDAFRPFVQRFARFDGPTVVTGSPSSLGARSAVLEGSINPEGAPSSYFFEYGTDPTIYGKRVPLANTDVGSGGAAVSAVAPVEGLEPNKAYYFRIVGSNDAGSIFGASGTFTTMPAPATVDGSAFASAITPRTVRLHSMVNPNNAQFAIYSFEYGPTTSYGTTVSGGLLCVSCGGVAQPAIVNVPNLEPGSTYHFRVVADNGEGGPQVGPDHTFITSPAGGGGAKDVTAGRATLTGTIDPHGVATTYHFNYGPTSSYGLSTPEVGGGAGEGDRLVSHGVSGLLPDTTYHVQVVATSADGVVRAGGDGLFQTAPAPTAEVIGPTGVSTNAATLVGNVNTFGLTGSYHFDVWSLDSPYAVSTTERPVSGNVSAERVNAALTGLPAGEAYVVQLSVSSNDAISVSDLLPFATAEVPSVFPGPPTGTGLYGCGSPRLNAYNERPKPGETITITGQDLGIGGEVTLGDRPVKPSEWSASGFKVVVPEKAGGSLALTVNCGRRSNTVAVAVFQEPENAFAVTSRSVSGTTATLKVRVPGPGNLQSFGVGTRAAKVTVKRPGTATIRVKLTSAAARALGRAAGRTLKVKARVRFTPAGGRPASKTVAITFKRKGGR